MTKVTGTVDVVSAKAWNNVMLYSFQINGEPRWYRMGKVAPTFKEGDQIMFEEYNNNVNTNTIQLTGNATDGYVSSVGAPVVSSASPPNQNVGLRMRYQAARRDAANVVVAALHTDSLPWAANVAKAKKLDLLTGYIQQITQTLLEQENANVAE